MAICRHFHKPDLFLTMTANPKWPEILHSLFPGQTATDHSDIVSQVFKQKKKALLKLIDNGFFGTTIAHIHTIEFQKRGLPHIYLLIFLHSQYRIQDSHHINSMISAQLPDPQLQPLLYAKVTKYMLHGLCGADNPQAKCMVNGKYSKHFPKEYRERTDWAKDVTNFIRPYLHQFFDDSHSLNGYGKPLRRPFYWYQSLLKAISIGRDIRQINW